MSSFPYLIPNRRRFTTPPFVGQRIGPFDEPEAESLPTPNARLLNLSTMGLPAINSPAQVDSLPVRPSGNWLYKDDAAPALPPAPIPSAVEPFLSQSRAISADRLATPEVMNRVGELGPMPQPPPVIERIEAGNQPLPSPVMPSRVTVGNPIDRAIASTPEPPRRVAGKGFWNRLGAIGKGVLFGGATGGLGGALYGGIASGINPQTAENMQFNLQDRPRWDAGRARAMQQAELEQQGILRNKQIENIDFDNQTSRLNQDIARERLTTEKETRETAKTEKAVKEKEDAAYREVAAAHRQKRPVNRALVVGTSQEVHADTVPPAPPVKIGDYRFPTQTDAQGRLPYVRVNEAGSLEGGYVPGIEFDRYEKPKEPDKVSPTEAQKQAEFEFNSNQGDRVAERTKRINDLLPPYTQGLREKAANGDTQAIRTLNAIETEAAKTVDLAMNQEREREVSKRANEILRQSQAARTPRTPSRITRGSNPARLEVSQADIEEFARAKGISVEEAKRKAQAEGYTVR